MKRSIFILSLILILTLTSAIAFAEGEIIVRIDSENVVFNEEMGKPFIDENNRTLVPFKVTMESYGAEVEWNNETRTAIAKKGDITVEVPIGEPFILKNGEKIESDTVSIIKEGRTYLPIRKVIETFGSEVQWDGKANTVVIITDPIDARSVLMESYAKSYDWENYDMNMLMDITMPIPNELGEIGEMKMLMDMKLTAFMKPMKVKAVANMNIDMGTDTITQPLMEMYYTVEEDKFATYMGMYLEPGTLTWTQSTMENEMISELLNSDVKTNMELNEESITAVRYLGKYLDENGKSLLKFENTTSFEAYSEIMGSYMEMLSASSKQEDMLAVDMLSNMGDITFIIFVDETTGEISRYEMDLGSLMTSMFSSMGESEMMPAEAIEMLKSMKMNMVMDVLNINAAQDFEIPEEALNAPAMEAVLTEESN